MNLKSYIATERGNATKLAAALGILPSFLSQMASGERAITAERAAALEKYTDGAITRRETHPDTWQDIWPELVNATTKAGV